MELANCLARYTKYHGNERSALGTWWRLAETMIAWIDDDQGRALCQLLGGWGRPLHHLEAEARFGSKVEGAPLSAEEENRNRRGAIPPGDGEWQAVASRLTKDCQVLLHN